ACDGGPHHADTQTHFAQQRRSLHTACHRRDDPNLVAIGEHRCIVAELEVDAEPQMTAQTVQGRVVLDQDCPQIREGAVRVELECLPLEPDPFPHCGEVPNNDLCHNALPC